MTQINDQTSYEIRDGVGVLFIDNPPVNALSYPVREGLAIGMRQLVENSSVKAIVLACKGRTFIAGADIREFGAPKRKPAASYSIEDAPKPVVAAIHGTALGGGLELAMQSHFRVALADARFGLPEVNLGILPGGRGTQRLPRIVGVQRALELITSGDQIGVDEALKCGLIDEVIEGDIAEGAVNFANKVIAEDRPLRRVRDRDEKLAEVRDKPEVFAKFRKSIARKTRGFKAPEKIVQCVEAAVNKEWEEAIQVETELFDELVASPESAAQRYYFFAERQARKIPDVPKDTPIIPVNKVGIIGAGTMGGGIAMNFANVGTPVHIVEVKEELLQRGLKVVRGNYERTASKGRITQRDVEDRMGLIKGSLNMQDLADCDLIIEAVYENMDLKKRIFARLDELCREGAILGSNTSGLNINEIASVTKRPESVIGLHFFSPANVMKLLEVVRGDKTSKSVIATSMALAKAIDKVAVLVGVCKGFVGNRMGAGRRRESEAIILEGAAPWDVDRVIFDFGFPMGPFAMSDLAGLDIGWDPETSKGETIKDRLCEQGRRGQKTGKGYYNYDPKTREKTPEPNVAQLIADFAEEKGIKQREITDDEIIERCLYPMVNEGAKILKEGIAIRASDIDVVWCNGFGWPKYRGGPMYWANSVGLDKIVARMKEFQAEFGDQWEPSPLLLELASEGKPFA